MELRPWKRIKELERQLTRTGDHLVEAQGDKDELKAIIEQLNQRVDSLGEDITRIQASASQEINATEFIHKARIAELEGALDLGIRTIEDQDRRMTRLIDSGNRIARAYVELKAKSEAAAPSEVAGDKAANFLDIVFEPMMGEPGLKFVEVENTEGQSINVGEWLKDPRGFNILRIPAHEVATR